MANHEFRPANGDPQYCACGLHKNDTEHTGGAAGVNPATAGAMDAVKELLGRIQNLLSQAGTWGQCKGCFGQVYWIKTRSLQNVPYNLDGTVHFDTCLEQRQFQKKKEPQS